MALVAQVPRGRVTTCGDLARALGDVVAARWIGHWLLHHRHEPGCGCHRVVRAGGHLGGYVGSLDQKRRLLAAEGVDLDGERIDLTRYAITQFRSDAPLARLRAVQQSLLVRRRIEPLRALPEWIAGVDVSYFGAKRAVAAYALVEAGSRELIWSTTVECPARFPYISSFLSFRELPLYISLLDEVRRQGRLADVLLVDGAGIMHPRGAGVATHLGIVAGVPTIGVTKKLLYGQVDLAELQCGQQRDVTANGQRLGAAIRPTARGRKPIYVSPGHGVDVAGSLAIVAGQLTGRRLPEPIYWADRLSREAARQNRTART